MAKEQPLWDIQMLKLDDNFIDTQELLLFAMRAIALSMAVPQELFMSSKIIAEFSTIKPEKHYRNSLDNIVFSGKQLKQLLELAKPTVQAMLLLSIVETDEPVTNPNSKYGV